MRHGAERREKKPARTQRHEAVAPAWYAQARLGQNGGADESARVLMPWDCCTSRANCNLQSTTFRLNTDLTRVGLAGRVGLPENPRVRPRSSPLTATLALLLALPLGLG